MCLFHHHHHQQFTNSFTVILYSAKASSSSCDPKSTYYKSLLLPGLLRIKLLYHISSFSLIPSRPAWDRKAARVKVCRRVCQAFLRPQGPLLESSMSVRPPARLQQFSFFFSTFFPLSNHFSFSFFSLLLLLLLLLLLFSYQSSENGLHCSEQNNIVLFQSDN